MKNYRGKSSQILTVETAVMPTNADMQMNRLALVDALQWKHMGSRGLRYYRSCKH